MNIIYYHYYCTDLSFDILLNTLDDIKKSKLYDDSSVLTINIVGDNSKDHFKKIEKDVLPNFNKLKLKNYRSKELQEYMNSFSDLEIKSNQLLSIGKTGLELDTLKLLYDEVNMQDIRANVLYIHGKGSVHQGKHGSFNSRKEWRLKMIDDVIYNWRKCVSNLETQPHSGSRFCRKHYSGNFWWATSDYIKSKKCPIEYAKSNRRVECKLRQSPFYSAEFWILS